MLYLMLPLTPGPEVLGRMPPQMDLPEVLMLDNPTTHHTEDTILAYTLGK